LAGLLQGNQGRETQYLNAAGQGYQGQQNQYATQQAGKNSLLGGAAQLAPLAIRASDERLKINVERSTLEALPGVPFASWEWAHAPGERHYGVIAQDLERVAPQYVRETPDGVKMVDYSFLEANHG
jgi:surface antigen